MAIHPKDMSPEDREKFHLAAEAEIQKIAYEKPAPNGRPKQNTWMVRRPHMQVVVQCVHDGGENNLHYHTNSETTWFVLKGRAVFEGKDGKILAELDEMEGVVIPGGARYKFYKDCEDDLEILQMVAVHNPEEGSGERINLEAHREWMADSEHLLKY